MCFQIQYAEAILSNNTRKLSLFEIAEMPIAVEMNLLCQFTTNSFRHTFVACRSIAGARLRDDRRDQPLLVRLRQRAQPGRQDRRHLPTLLRTTLVAVALRLRHARRQVGADGRRKPQGT